MRNCIIAWLALVVLGCSRADDKPKPAALTPQEIADGWIMLFDGETAFGWKIDGDAKVEDGKLAFFGKTTTATTTTEFSEFDFKSEGQTASDSGGEPTLQMIGDPKTNLWGTGHYPPDGTRLQLGAIRLSSPGLPKLHYLKIKPRNLTPLFNGKDLSGWKQFTGDPKREKSKFSVTPEGWLNVIDGPGDLQTEKQFADFVLQAECISNGKNLNSGIFFRALPGQYQQGYEAQIHNGYKDGDRTKPMDYGTGAIYRRVPARKVVSNDHEWFTMTVVAHGNHIATWVNGYQTVDFTDTRPANDNARNGSKTAAGVISIQGHDPTTNLSFRNIRIAELPKKN